MSNSEHNYKVTSYTRDSEDKLNSIKETIKNFLAINDERIKIINDFDIIFVIHENDNIDKIKGFALCEILDTEKSNIDNNCVDKRKSLFIDSFIINQNDKIDELLSDIIGDFKNKNYNYLISSSKLKNFKNHYENGFRFINCNDHEIGNDNNKDIFEIPDKLNSESPIVELCNELIKNNLLTTRLDNSGNKLYTSGFKMTLKRENIPKKDPKLVGGCNK